MKLGKLGRYAGILLVLLLINTAYIAAFASPTIFYMGNVVLHLALGVALGIMLLWFIRRMPLAGSLFLIAALAGVYLAVRGNTVPHRWVLQAHIVVAALALLALVPYVVRHTGAGFRNAYAACLALLVVFPAATALYRKAHPDPDVRIRNPLIVPASMNEEGGGPRSPFFPSSAKTNVGGIIPSNFFMDSEACGRCHKDRSEERRVGKDWSSDVCSSDLGRRSTLAVLSVLGQDQRWRHHSLELLHGFGGVRALSQGYLPAVEKLDAPLRVVQQPVLPEVHRVYAKRGRHAAEQMVRGLARSRGLLQWPGRPAHQGPHQYARGPRGPVLHLLPRHHARGQFHGQWRLYD